MSLYNSSLLMHALFATSPGCLDVKDVNNFWLWYPRMWHPIPSIYHSSKAYEREPATRKLKPAVDKAFEINSLRMKCRENFDFSVMPDGPCVPNSSENRIHKWIVGIFSHLRVCNQPHDSSCDSASIRALDDVDDSEIIRSLWSMWGKPHSSFSLTRISNAAVYRVYTFR